MSTHISSKQLTEAFSQNEEHVRGTTAAIASVFLFLSLPGVSQRVAKGPIPLLPAAFATHQHRCANQMCQVGQTGVVFLTFAAIKSHEHARHLSVAAD